MTKLTHPAQADIIVNMLRHYAEHRLAISNADSWYIAYHGEAVLTAAGALGMPLNSPELRGVKNAVRAAAARRREVAS